MKNIKSIIETSIVLLGIVLFLKFFVLGFFYVASDSMYPELVEGDYIIVSKLSYNLFSFQYTEPQKGDVVVIDYEGLAITKRIIAEPGDSIVFNERNIFVNGLGLIFNEYKSISDFYKYVPSSKIQRQYISPNSDNYFFAGDFLELSKDSRFFGTKSKKDIIGKAIFIYLSKDTKNNIRTNRIGTFIK